MFSVSARSLGCPRAFCASVLAWLHNAQFTQPPDCGHSAACSFKLICYGPATPPCIGLLSVDGRTCLYTEFQQEEMQHFFSSFYTLRNSAHGVQLHTRLTHCHR